MQPMPRPRKPYVQREKTRHKKTVWYFRRGDGPRIRLPGEYESAEWLRAYEEALAISAGAAPAPKAGKGTLGWLIDRYFDSLAFSSLAPGTQKARRSILNRIKEKSGQNSVASVTRGVIAKGRDARKDTPAAAANFVKTMKALFAWAVEAELAATNPVADLKNPAPKTDGHHTWTIQEVLKFWERHPLGTMPRLAADIMLFTGMRESDARLFGPQHIKNGWGSYRSQKTKIEATFPILPALQASIDASQTGDLVFILSSYGRPFKSAAAFQHWFTKQCVAAGVPGRAHGLRKAGATFAAENGATDQQLMAMFGWTDARQASVYTRTASKSALAGEAAQRLAQGQNGNVLSPHLQSSAPHPKK